MSNYPLLDKMAKRYLAGERFGDTKPTPKNDDKPPTFSMSDWGGKFVKPKELTLEEKIRLSEEL